MNVIQHVNILTFIVALNHKNEKSQQKHFHFMSLESINEQWYMWYTKANKQINNKFYLFWMSPKIYPFCNWIICTRHWWNVDKIVYSNSKLARTLSMNNSSLWILHIPMCNRHRCMTERDICIQFILIICKTIYTHDKHTTWKNVIRFVIDIIFE